MAESTHPGATNRSSPPSGVVPIPRPRDDIDPHRQWWTDPPLICLLLLVIICAVFGRTMFNDFVDWDDGSLIYVNDTMKPPLTIAKLAHHWNPSAQQNYHMYDPLVFTAWWLLAHVAQTASPNIVQSSLDPRVFHAAGLLLHWLNACIVLQILRKLDFPIWASACGTLIFAIHPLQTEPVAWAAAMKDLLSGFFALLAIWRYLIATTSPPKEFKFNYALATLFFALALLSKPSAVIIPLIAGAFDILLFQKPIRRTALLLTPWLLLSLIFIQISRNMQNGAQLPVPIWIRPGVAADALAFYLYKLLLPIHLSADYARSPQALLENPELYHPLYWTWIFPAALTFLLWRMRQPMLQMAALVCFLGLLPVLGFVAFVYQYFSTVADRYMYLPMLGVAIAVAWVLSKYAKPSVIVAFSILLVVLGSLAFVQAGIWHDTGTLFENTIAQNQTRWNEYLTLAHYYDRLARAAGAKADEEANLGETAEAQQDQSVSIAYMQKSARNLQDAIANNPRRPQLYRLLIGEMLFLHQDEDAITWMRRLLVVEPPVDPEIQHPLEQTHVTIALTLFRLHRLPEATDELRQNPGALALLRQSLIQSPSPAIQSWLDEAFPPPQTPLQ